MYDVIFLLSDIYQLKSAMCKNVFLYSKTGPAPVWLDSESYNSTFYLVTLGEEIDCGRKMWNKRTHTETPKKSWYAKYLKHRKCRAQKKSRKLS